MDGDLKLKDWRNKLMNRYVIWEYCAGWIKGLKNKLSLHYALGPQDINKWMSYMVLWLEFRCLKESEPSVKEE